MLMDLKKESNQHNATRGQRCSLFDKGAANLDSNKEEAKESDNEVVVQWVRLVLWTKVSK